MQNRADTAAGRNSSAIGTTPSNEKFAPLKFAVPNTACHANSLMRGIPLKTPEVTLINPEAPTPNSPVTLRTASPVNVPIAFPS